MKKSPRRHLRLLVIIMLVAMLAVMFEQMAFAATL